MTKAEIASEIYSRMSRERMSATAKQVTIGNNPVRGAEHRPVQMWMRCRNPGKRKDALVEEVKKMREAGIRKSKSRISSDTQKEKHPQMNVSA